MGHVIATRFVRMLGGASKAALIEASDYQQYIVKWAHGPYSPIDVRKEALRNSVYQFLGLPVSSWSPIEVTDDFIDCNKAMRIWCSGILTRPAGGIHFGSRLICDIAQHTYEILPGDWYPRVINRSDFWAAYTLDIWTTRCAKRQALFRSLSGTSDLIAIFIDHGDLASNIGPPDGSDFKTCLYHDKRVYERHQMAVAIHSWISQIQAFGRSAIAGAYGTLPADWKTTSIDAMARAMVNRIDKLNEVLFPSIEALQRGLFPMQPSRSHLNYGPIHNAQRA